MPIGLMYPKLHVEKFFVSQVMRGLTPTNPLVNMALRMDVYTRMASQMIVMGWAATCDEQMDRHRTIAYTARA